MLIENKAPRLLVISGGPSKRVRLMPGINEVDEQDWKHAMNRPVEQHWVREGLLVPVEQPAEKRSGQERGALKKKTVSEAKELIKKTVDRELLRKWLKEETRKSLKGALEAQIEAVTVKPKASDEDDS